MAKRIRKFALGWAERVLKRVQTPLPLKEAAWRLIRFLALCGKSNPISFAVRPVLAHKRLRASLGMSLVVMVVSAAIWGPSPWAADDSGGRLDMVVVPEGEVRLKTDEAVQSPLAVYRVSQGFGWSHSGLDMAAESGTPVRPLMTGVVTEAKRSWLGYGNMVKIKHEGEYESLYAHLSEIGVSVGQYVGMGTVLGKAGSTGRSSGPHLHLEIYEGGKPVNPASILGI